MSMQNELATSIQSSLNKLGIWSVCSRKLSLMSAYMELYTVMVMAVLVLCLAVLLLINIRDGKEP
jgi:hypothetical protein